MRVGIIAWLHESNTFVKRTTTRKDFEADLLVTGEAVRDKMENAKHEVGGFFSGLAEAEVEAVPIFVARAYPSGVIEADSFAELEDLLLSELESAGQLDGILAAPHGATVSEDYPDADGRWLGRVREAVGPDLPIIATIDPHANLSEQMVDATNAIFAYRTNPHLDQKETGERAARLMIRTLRGEVKPTQAAGFPSMAINIQCQQTSEEPLLSALERAAEICAGSEVLSHSVVLGFPYADVVEMGSSMLVVTDDDPVLARELSGQMADYFWDRRRDFEPDFSSVVEAVDLVEASADRCLLLDMGDNVGGGSPADSTFLCSELDRRAIGPAFVCLCDPVSVKESREAGMGNRVTLQMGAKTDRDHGDPLSANCRVLGFYDGKFRESKVRHGGFSEFDQGETVIVETDRGLTVMLTSLRMPPFSLEQLTSCEVDPLNFRVIIAKGVIAPLAAYAPVCDRIIHVNTGGSTCADMKRLEFRSRRKPLFPFES